MSSFNQMYDSKHLDKVKKVGVTLCGKCNEGVNFSDERLFILYIFNIWLVQGGNVNSFPSHVLKVMAYCVTYDLFLTWFVHCPDGGVLKFKKDIGVCEGFSYINLKNLNKHIITSNKSVSFKKRKNHKRVHQVGPPRHLLCHIFIKIFLRKW